MVLRSAMKAAAAQFIASQALISQEEHAKHSRA
jgi:hypothetical protein